jgi:hypothetical protein
VGAGGCAAAIALTASALLAGCSSLQTEAVDQVAARFEDPSGTPAARCELLAPATRAELEAQQHASCQQVVAGLAVHGGTVRSVQVWGGDAQVRLAGDTVFLAQGRGGWQVTAAGCRPRGDAPYVCLVEGP